MNVVKEQVWRAGKYATVAIVLVSCLPVLVPFLFLLCAFLITFVLPLGCGIAGFLYLRKYAAMLYRRLLFGRRSPGSQTRVASSAHHGAITFSPLSQKYAELIETSEVIDREFDAVVVSTVPKSGRSDADTFRQDDSAPSPVTNSVGSDAYDREDPSEAREKSDNEERSSGDDSDPSFTNLQRGVGGDRVDNAVSQDFQEEDPTGDEAPMHCDCDGQVVETVIIHDNNFTNKDAVARNAPVSSNNDETFNADEAKVLILDDSTLQETTRESSLNEKGKKAVRKNEAILSLDEQDAHMAEEKSMEEAEVPDSWEELVTSADSNVEEPSTQELSPTEESSALISDKSSNSSVELSNVTHPVYSAVEEEVPPESIAEPLPELFHSEFPVVEEQSFLQDDEDQALQSQSREIEDSLRDDGSDDFSAHVDEHYHSLQSVSSEVGIGAGEEDPDSHTMFHKNDDSSESSESSDTNGESSISPSYISETQSEETADTAVSKRGPGFSDDTTYESEEQMHLDQFAQLLQFWRGREFQASSPIGHAQAQNQHRKSLFGRPQEQRREELQLREELKAIKSVVGDQESSRGPLRSDIEELSQFLGIDLPAMSDEVPELEWAKVAVEVMKVVVGVE